MIARNITEAAPRTEEAWSGIDRPAGHEFAATSTRFVTKGSAQAWFEGGSRLLYHTSTKRIVPDGEVADPENLLRVFHRVRRDASGDPGSRWTTFLPGFPDGSYGWARVDHLLGDKQTPRLFVEFVGQGDSDKPTDYGYSTFERADVVEAQWQAHGVRSTFIVAFDYSALAVLELLSRQEDREEAGAEPFTKIEGVLVVNGGLFADAHSHPWQTTPLLKTPMGRVGTWFAQRSRTVFYAMMRDLYSKEYAVTKEELEELYQAITRRNGAQFLSRAARFVDEHKANDARWDLARLFHAMRDSVSFHVAGSEQDPFEYQQVACATERLGKKGLDIHTLPGGHLTTSEHPDLLADLVLELA